MKRTEIKINENHTRIIYGEVEPHTYSKGVIMETRGSDGSRLEKPMSKAYIKNIRSRSVCDSDTSRTIYPGDYGSGKKVPRDR